MNPSESPDDGPAEIEGPEGPLPEVRPDPETGELPAGWEWTDD